MSYTSVYVHVHDASSLATDMFMISYNFRLLQSLGQSKLFSAESCKNIKEANEYITKTHSLPDDCTPSFGNGVYWIQNMQVCKFSYIAIVTL